MTGRSVRSRARLVSRRYQPVSQSKTLLRFATYSVAYCYVYCSKGSAMSQTTPRIAPLQPPYAPEIAEQFDRIMRGAPPLMLFRVMAGNARAWEKFRAGSLLDRGPLG